MTYTQMIDPTEFWSWQKVEAGHYVLTTDDRYTAIVRKDRWETAWSASAASPSGRVRTTSNWHDFETMADAREWALGQIDHLVQQDETEALARRLSQKVINPRTNLFVGEVEMNGPGDQTASFIIPLGGSRHHTYKVTVERWNG